MSYSTSTLRDRHRRRRRPSCAARRDAVADADLVELRLDSVSDPDVAGALAGRRPPVIVTCRPDVGRRRVRGIGRGARAHPRRRARAGRRVRRRRVRAPASTICSRQTGGTPHRAVDARLRRRAGRSRRRASQAMRATGAEVVKIAVKAHALERLRAAARPRRRGRRPDGRAGADRHGRLRTRRRACCRRVSARRWTYAGLARRTSASSRARRCSTTTASASVTDCDRRLRRRRWLGGALGVAGDAQRRVPGGGHRRRLSAVAGGRRRRFRRRSAARSASAAPASRFRYKVALFDRVDEVDAIGAAHRRHQHDSRRSTDGGWARNTDVAGFLAPLRDRVPLTRGARGRARRGRRGARGGRRAGVERRAR